MGDYRRSPSLLFGELAEALESFDEIGAKIDALQGQLAPFYPDDGEARLIDVSGRYGTRRTVVLKREGGEMVCYLLKPTSASSLRWPEGEAATESAPTFGYVDGFAGPAIEGDGDDDSGVPTAAEASVAVYEDGGGLEPLPQ